MADGADFLNGDDLEAILDILEADKEMDEEFLNEDENVSNLISFFVAYSIVCLVPFFFLLFAQPFLCSSFTPSVLSFCIV